MYNLGPAVQLGLRACRSFGTWGRKWGRPFPRRGPHLRAAGGEGARATGPGKSSSPGLVGGASQDPGRSRPRDLAGPSPSRP